MTDGNSMKTSCYIDFFLQIFAPIFDLIFEHNNNESHMTHELLLIYRLCLTTTTTKKNLLYQE